MHERESARDGWSISDGGHYCDDNLLDHPIPLSYDLDLGVVHHECVVPEPD